MAGLPLEVALILQVVQEGDVGVAIGVQNAAVNIQERIAGVVNKCVRVRVLLRDRRVQPSALDVPPRSIARVQLHVVPARGRLHVP